jgi:hypothetical protein
MTPRLTLPTSPARELERAVADAHALATALYAEAGFALDCGFDVEAQRVYGWGEQAFLLGLRTECALLELRRDRDAR